MSAAPLILLSDRIGDTLFATPALALLASALQTKLDVLAPNEAVASVLTYNPIIDTIHIAATKKSFADLAKNYKTVISLSNNQAVKNIMSSLNRSDIYRLPSDFAHEPRYEFFVRYVRSLIPENPASTLPTQYQIFPQTQHTQAAQQLLENVGCQPKDILIACHLGCHRMAKQGKQVWRRKLNATGSKSWPSGAFLQLAKRLATQHPQIKLLLIGTQAERKLASDLLPLPNTIDLFGKTDLLTLAALLKHINLLITCDTGPLHIACAMQTPLVALFGKTDPLVWGPYPRQADRLVIEGESMEAISVDDVYTAILKQLPTLENVMSRDLSHAKKILLISSHRIGDAIFLTPAIAGLQTVLPTAHIDLIAIEESVVDVYAYNPAIKTIFTISKEISLPHLGAQYDAVIALYNNSRTRACGQALGVPVFYPEERPCEKHRRDYFVDFFSQFFPNTDFQGSDYYQLFPQIMHDHIAKTLLLSAGISVEYKTASLIVCHMGCYRLARQGKKWWQWGVKTDGSKSWPVESFIKLNQLLQQALPGCKLILTGTTGEKKLARPLIKSADNVIDLIGRTSLLELAALMRYADAMVTGDTGPMHVACAMGLPLVALFGPTDPAITAPYPTSPKHCVMYHADLSAISPKSVCDQLLTVMNDSAAKKL